jgi:hypothetical protein
MGYFSAASDIAAAMLAPGATLLVLYHFLIDSHALAELADGPSIDRESGDLVIFPHEAAHDMTSGLSR